MVILGLLTVAAPTFAQTAPDESDPLIAAVILYSASYSIERWESYCATESPASSDAIASARSAWMDSHANLIDKAAVILQTKYSRDERIDIAVQTRLANDELEHQLSAAPKSARREWCYQSPQRILSPELDFNRRSTLVAALQAFSP